MTYDPDPSPRKGLAGRLAMYLTGVAIGLVLLGFFFMAKKNEAARQQAEAERQRSQPAPDNGLFPPIPTEGTK